MENIPDYYYTPTDYGEPDDPPEEQDTYDEERDWREFMREERRAAECSKS